jgi:hypothetical protein
MFTAIRITQWTRWVYLKDKFSPLAPSPPTCSGSPGLIPRTRDKSVQLFRKVKPLSDFPTQSTDPIVTIIVLYTI